MDKTMYDLLLRSFDGSLNKSEQSLLDKSLVLSEELEVTKQEIAQLRKAYVLTRDSSFKPFFAERVLQRLTEIQKFYTDWLVVVFRRVAITGVILAALLACYNVSNRQSVNIESVLGLPQPTLENVLALEVPFQ